MVIKSRENDGLLCAGSALRWAESIQQQPKNIAKERPAYMQTPSALGLAWFTISSPLRFLFSFFFDFSSIRFSNNRSHHLLSGGEYKYHPGRSYKCNYRRMRIPPHSRRWGDSWIKAIAPAELRDIEGQLVILFPMKLHHQKDSRNRMTSSRSFLLFLGGLWGDPFVAAKDTIYNISCNIRNAKQQQGRTRNTTKKIIESMMALASSSFIISLFSIFSSFSILGDLMTANLRLWLLVICLSGVLLLAVRFEKEKNKFHYSRVGHARTHRRC